MTDLIAVVHGIAASVVSAACLALLGLTLTRRRWDSLLGGASFPVVGAAFYVILCWVAVTAWRAPLSGVTALIAVCITIVAVLRFADISSVVRPMLGGRTLVAAVLVFSAFYVLAYAFARPPSAELFLPPASARDIDLITQARYAKHLMLFGSPELEGASFDFRRSPAVTELLAALSMFYRDDPLSAALPLRFAVVGLVGTAAVGICRSLFRLSMLSAITIACIVVTSSYTNDIAGVYRLEALAAVAVLLYLVWVTAKARADTPIDALAVSFACGYAFLSFTVPAALPAGIVMQSIAMVVQSASRPAASRIAIAAAGAIAAVAVAFHDQTQWAVAHFAWADALAPTGFVLAILIMAGIVHLVASADWMPRLMRAETDRRLAAALTGYVAIALIIANVATYASARTGAQVHIPVAWRNVEQLKERDAREVTMKLTRDPDDVLTSLTRYYLPSASVHVIPPRARFGDFGAISRQSPVVIQNFGCEGVGHTDTISLTGVGCALMAPPSVALDTAYPFNRTFLAVDFDNMSDREAGGRWSTGRRLPLTLLADPERTAVDRNLHVNLLLNQFLPADAGAQRLVLTWGAEKKGLITLEKPGWISVPVTSGDWSGKRVWRLPISIDVPDGRRILFQELSLSESARGPVVH